MVKLKKPPDKKNKNKVKLNIQAKKEKDIKRYENFSTTYKTVKTSLKSVVRDNSTIVIINRAVKQMNKIVIHTYNFLKLYCLHTLSITNKMPDITEDLINYSSKIMCKEDPRGSKPSKETLKLKETLKTFYNNHYKQLIYKEEELSYTCLNTVLDYEKTNMITVMKNHIMNHFYDFLNRYVNVIVKKKKFEQAIKDNSDYTTDEQKKLISEYRSSLTKLKKDLYKNEDLCSKQYIKLKKKIRNKLFPKLEEKETIMTLVNSDQFKVIPMLVKMSIEIENLKEKTFNCFPLRKNIIPKYIKIDATTIVHLLFPDKVNDIKKANYLNKGNTLLLRDNIWEAIFKINKKEFNSYNRNKKNNKGKIIKDKYVFNNMITTDGVGCSILKIRHDLYNPLKKVKIRTISKPINYRPEKYINEYTDVEKEKYKNYTIVGIDPGKDDLIYATNGKVKVIKKEIKSNDGKIKIVGKHKPTTFRYSQNQRRMETKSKKYMKFQDNDKKITMIKNKSVKKYESELSKYDSKSCKLKNVKKYIKNKNRINYILQEYYEKDMYRKLKWYGYINRQKSENRMINNFKRIFGSPEEVLVCFGDYEQSKQMKYKEPTKGKGMRKIFRNNGYKVPLVNESYTSKRNFLTGGDNEKFRKRGNPRPWKNEIKLWHGLLRYKYTLNNEPKRHILVNRDYNGAMNIRQIAVCHLNNQERPSYLQKEPAISQTSSVDIYKISRTKERLASTYVDNPYFI